MPAIPAIALGVAAVGTGVSIYSAAKQAKYNKQAVQIQRQQAALQDARSKRDTIRQARISFAQAQSAAENQGASGTSSAQGGQGSIVSQLSDNLSFLDQYGLMTDQAQRALGKANSAGSLGKIGGDLAGFGMTVYANAPRISATVSKVFKPNG